jgi:ribonuclease D
VLVDNPAQFAALAEHLRAQPRIAIDTESDSLYRYFYKVCLIQISTIDADYLVDPLALPGVAELAPIFANPAIEKVFHAAENDILMLKRDFDFRFVTIFDTMVAARILGWPRVSLASVLSERFGVTLDKHAQLTDWGRRPLNEDQLAYARLDSHFLFALSDLQDAELAAHGRRREAQAAFTEIAAVSYVDRPFDPEGFWRMKGARDLRPADMAVLRGLYLWRDAEARRLDRPPFKVLGDDALVRFSQHPPRALRELHLGAWQARQFGPALLDAIDRALTAPPPQPPPRQNGNGRPDPAVTARFERLRAWRTRRATERGVEPDIVMNNEALMAIARAAPVSVAAIGELAVLNDWKIEAYGAELLAELASTS